VALTQDWIVILAIGVGIGGGLLASLIYDLIRPKEHPAATIQEDSRKPEPIAQRSPPLPAESSRVKPWLIGIGIISAIVWACTNYRRLNKH